MPLPGYPGVIPPRGVLWPVEPHGQAPMGLDDQAFAAAHPHGYGLTDNPSPWGYNRDVYDATHPPGTYGFYDPRTGFYSSPTELPFAGGPGAPDWSAYGTPPTATGWDGQPTRGDAYLPPWQDAGMPGAMTGAGSSYLAPAFEGTMPGAAPGGAPSDYLPPSMDAGMPGAGVDAGIALQQAPAGDSMPPSQGGDTTFADALAAYQDQTGQGDHADAGSWG